MLFDDSDRTYCHKIDTSLFGCLEERPVIEDAFSLEGASLGLMEDPWGVDRYPIISKSLYLLEDIQPETRYREPAVLSFLRPRLCNNEPERMNFTSPKDNSLPKYEERMLVPSDEVLKGRTFWDDEIAGLATQSTRSSLHRQQPQCDSA